MDAFCHCMPLNLLSGNYNGSSIWHYKVHSKHALQLSPCRIMYQRLSLVSHPLAHAQEYSSLHACGWPLSLCVCNGVGLIQVFSGLIQTIPLGYYNWQQGKTVVWLTDLYCSLRMAVAITTDLRGIAMFDVHRDCRSTMKEM